MYYEEQMIRHPIYGLKRPSKIQQESIFPKPVKQEYFSLDKKTRIFLLVLSILINIALISGISFLIFKICTQKACILCMDTAYLTGSECKAKSIFNQDCQTNSQCRNDLGLNCENNFCICNSSNFYWNGFKCSPKLTYSQQGCVSTDQCIGNLICNSYPLSNNCSCPINSSSGMCDCPRQLDNQMYWNGFTCVNATNQYLNCSKTYECLDGLTCDACSLTCLNQSACQLGWIHFDSKCYKTFSAINYASASSSCTTSFPISTFAVINDLTSLHFLKCKLKPSTQIYVSSVNYTCANDIVNPGTCPVLVNTTDSCMLSNCFSSIDVLCTYNI